MMTEDYTNQDIKVMKSSDDTDPDKSFIISHITYESKFGGKILQSLYLSEYMFNQLVFRVNQAKENYYKGSPKTEK